MKRSAKLALITALLLTAAAAGTACNNYDYAETDQLILDAAGLEAYLGQDNVVFVDMQSAEDYAAGHLEGAVNITLDQLMISVPVENMLTSPTKLSGLMAENGVGDDTLIIAYDSNKMDASRLLWSLMVYGNHNVRVVSGGIAAIQAAGYTLSSDTPQPALSSGLTLSDDKDSAWYVTIKEMQQLVNNPSADTVILDVRTEAEYLEGGKIPGAVLMDYAENFYGDGSFKDTMTTQIDYLENGMDPEKQIVIYCRTSVRAAPVFVRLYDAGYRNIRIFDGAWLEWTANSSNPIEYAATSAPAATQKDAS